MAATATQKVLMDKFVNTLAIHFPEFIFSVGSDFRWSTKDQTIFYDPKALLPIGSWALLHELSHGLLNHQSYGSDFGLLKLEVAAWEKAESLAKRYRVKIDPEHIQQCLDSYRDWLHRRSACPSCSNHSLQTDDGHYRCFNCHTTWKVTTSRFCRPYRQQQRFSTA